jgi:hypothetical protein
MDASLGGSLKAFHRHHLVRSGGCLLQNCLMAQGGLEEIQKENSEQSQEILYFKCTW